MDRKSAKVIPFPKKKTSGFRQVSGAGPEKISGFEKAELARAVEGKIAYLERDLENDASVLRKGVESFVRTMAGDRKDELAGSGVVFRSISDPGYEVVLESGEAAHEGAGEKVERIVQGCISAARADLAMLRSVKEMLEGGREIPPQELAKLKDILDKNSYWRLIEVT